MLPHFLRASGSPPESFVFHPNGGKPRGAPFSRNFDLLFDGWHFLHIFRATLPRFSGRFWRASENIQTITPKIVFFFFLEKWTGWRVKERAEVPRKS